MSCCCRLKVSEGTEEPSGVRCLDALPNSTAVVFGTNRFETNSPVVKLLTRAPVSCIAWTEGAVAVPRPLQVRHLGVQRPRPRDGDPAVRPARKDRRRGRQHRAGVPPRAAAHLRHGLRGAVPLLLERQNPAAGGEWAQVGDAEGGRREGGRPCVRNPHGRRCAASVPQARAKVGMKVKALAFSPDGEMLAIGTTEGVVKLLQIDEDDTFHDYGQPSR